MTACVLYVCLLELTFMFLGIYFVLLPEFDFATLESNTCKISVQLSPMQLMLFHTNELLNELISYDIYEL